MQPGASISGTVKSPVSLREMLYLYGVYEEENNFIHVGFSFVPHVEIGNPQKKLQ